MVRDGRSKHPARPGVTLKFPESGGRRAGSCCLWRVIAPRYDGQPREPAAPRRPRGGGQKARPRAGDARGIGGGAKHGSARGPGITLAACRMAYELRGCRLLQSPRNICTVPIPMSPDVEATVRMSRIKSSLAKPRARHIQMKIAGARGSSCRAGGGPMGPDALAWACPLYFSKT